MKVIAGKYQKTAFMILYAEIAAPYIQFQLRNCFKNYQQ